MRFFLVFAWVMKLPSLEGYSSEQQSLYMSETHVKMFTVNWSGWSKQLAFVCPGFVRQSLIMRVGSGSWSGGSTEWGSFPGSLTPLPSSVCRWQWWITQWWMLPGSLVVATGFPAANVLFPLLWRLKVFLATCCQQISLSQQVLCAAFFPSHFLRCQHCLC